MELSPEGAVAASAATEVNHLAQLGMARLLAAAAGVPAWEYSVLGAVVAGALVSYYLDLHFVGHLLWGDAIKFYFNAESPVARSVLPRFKVDRFWPTPWLCSSHLQTAYLHLFVKVPFIPFRRELLRAPDGGTFAVDWADPLRTTKADLPRQEDRTPIVIVVPGLTSDSNSRYVKINVAGVIQNGWRAVVTNHRGLGGVPITSDTFYNAGWTEDLRFAVKHIQGLYPNAPVCAIGSSLGANILVKYLGEEASSTPLLAAAAVGCPWDLVVCDRWMHRNSKQQAYARAMTGGLMNLAATHKEYFSKWANWDLLSASSTVREFDDRVTRLVGKYETVDTYYRTTSSAPFLPRVAVPLLCVNALDDPICTKEAIPWDECIANPRVLLGVTRHGGHLAYLEGFTASRIWYTAFAALRWVRHTVKFLQLVLESPDLLKLKETAPTAAQARVPSSRLDKAPLLSVTKNLAAPATLRPTASEQPLGPKQNGTEVYANGLQERERLHTNKSDEDDMQGGAAAQDGEGRLESVQELRAGEEGPQAGSIMLHFKDEEELSMLEGTLSMLLSQIREQKHKAEPSGSGQPALNQQGQGFRNQDPALMASASALAASSSAITSAAASVVKSATMVMSMATSIRKGSQDWPAAQEADDTRVLREDAAAFGRGATGVLDNDGSQALALGDQGAQPEAYEDGQMQADGLISASSASSDKLSKLLMAVAGTLGTLEAQTKRSTWVMIYVAVASTCPLVATALLLQLYAQGRRASR